MLADLGVRSVRLLTNNPAKVSGLVGCGVDITVQVPLASAVTPYNLRYLVTKRDKLGHQIQDLDEAERAVVRPSVPLNGRAATPHPVGTTGIVRISTITDNTDGTSGALGSSGVLGSESA
jgi:hypothetical protein